MLGAVCAGHRDAVGVGGAERKLVVCVVCGVAPGTGAVDAELAVAVAAGDIGLRHKGGGTVDIAGAEGAAGAQCGIGLSQAGGAVAGDLGRIVGTGEVDREGLGGGLDVTGRVVGHCHSEFFALVFTLSQCLDGRGILDVFIGTGAGGDFERAVGTHLDDLAGIGVAAWCAILDAVGQVNVGGLVVSTIKRTGEALVCGAA